MKILQLASRCDGGGVESYLKRLVLDLASRDHEVLVIAGDGGKLSPPPKVQIVPGYYRFGAPRGKAEEVLRLAAEFSPEVVHVHEMNNYPLALALAGRWPTLKHSHIDFTCAVGGRRFWRRSRRACFRTVGPACLWHYYAAPCGPGPDPRWALWSYRRSRGALRTWPRMRKILVNSECLRRSCVAAGLPEEMIESLYLPTPQAEESPRAAEAEGQPGVLFVGRMMPEKGLEDLLRAMAQVRSACRLVAVGDGPARASSEKLAASLDLPGRVEFAGWQEDVEPYWRRASLLVVPSLWPEPFGIVGIEAMARALPVVAYRSGGIPEWLADGQTGRLVEPGDVAGLAAAVDEVLSDPAKARSMGRAGQRRQRELFGTAGHLARLEEIYRELLAG